MREKGAISEGLRDFLIADTYLSPFTSYPVNGTLRLLFSMLFQRIYDDFYLLSGDGYLMLSRRAYSIYNHFSDILFELLRSDPPTREKVEFVTKEMIFYWNVASTRFDLCSLLAQMYTSEGNYHLGIDGLVYKIANLDTEKDILSHWAAESVLVEGSIPLTFLERDHREYEAESMENPFTSLRPCIIFKDMERRSDLIPIEDILSPLHSKLDEGRKRKEEAES